jgi:hypothetical protein
MPSLRRHGLLSGNSSKLQIPETEHLKEEPVGAVVVVLR